MQPEFAASAWESPELVRLFHTYTASPESIGAHLGRLTARGAEFDPLIVATGTDIALYPGDGAAPMVEMCIAVLTLISCVRCTWPPAKPFILV